MSLRNWTAEERKRMEAATGNDVDQWIANAVFKIVRRTGVPITRIIGDELYIDLEGRTRRDEGQGSSRGKGLH